MVTKTWVVCISKNEVQPSHPTQMKKLLAERATVAELPGTIRVLTGTLKLPGTC